MTTFNTKQLGTHNTITIVNVGSYKVRTIICSFLFNEIKILGYGEKRQSRHDIINNEINNISGVCETIYQSLLKAEMEAGYSPEDIHINPFCSKVFFHSKTLHYKRHNTNNEIDKVEVLRIMKQLEQLSIQSIYSNIQSKYGFGKDDIDLILSNVNQISLDGKIIKELLGENGEDISIQLLNTFIPKINYNIIEEISGFLGKKVINLIPEEYALTKIGDPEKENIFIDIGNSHTSLMLKKEKNFLSNALTLDIGIGDLVKEITKSTGKSRGEIIKKIDRDDLFKKEKHLFLSFFGDALITGLEELLGGMVCPYEFIMSGGGANNMFIKEFLQHLDVQKAGIKILKPIEIHSPCIKEIKKIRQVEDILKVSNINLIAQIIATDAILHSPKDSTQIALEKSIKKIMG